MPTDNNQTDNNQNFCSTLPPGPVVQLRPVLTEQSISAFQKWAADQAETMGWNTRPIPFPEMAALVHSEITEALESYRNHEDLLWYGPDGKPEGIAAEFADAVIRIMHYAELLGFNLENVVREKLQYNATRGYRHGNKRI